MRENSLSGSVNLFKGVNIIDVHPKWFRNFRRFKLSRVNFVRREPKLVRVIGSFENQGFEKLEVKLQSLSEANPRETRFGSRY